MHKISPLDAGLIGTLHAAWSSVSAEDATAHPSHLFPVATAPLSPGGTGHGLERGFPLI